MFLIVLGLVFIALAFDFINGFHDAANSIATVVSTRVLSPGKAVIWAAFFNFVAAFPFGTAVAKTIGSGMIDIKIVTFSVIAGGLIGAIVWDLITWYYGLPTSSSHALIGGYAGAAVAKAGVAAILPGGWTKTLVFIVLSPLIGMALGLAIIPVALANSVAWLAVAAILLVPVAPPAQAQTGAVQGKVTDTAGKPVEKATIAIEFTDGINRKYEVKTNKKGEFIQLGLQPGPYKIVASKEKLSSMPSQVNIRAGKLPPAETDGVSYLRVPLNVIGRPL